MLMRFLFSHPSSQPSPLRGEGAKCSTSRDNAFISPFQSYFMRGLLSLWERARVRVKT